MRGLAAGLLCLVLVGCASPNVTSSPTLATTPPPAPTSTPASSPIAITHAAITCPLVKSLPSASANYCPAEEAAIYAAVAYVDDAVASMTILGSGFICGQPFFDGLCPVFAGFPTGAYVTFIGTANVAALLLSPQISLALQPNTSFSASVVAFQVPPAGWGTP